MKTFFRDKKIILINTVLVLGLLTFSTCLDPIDLEIPEGFDNTLVVQGSLIKGNPSLFELTISRLFDFTPESVERVNVREVILTDESGKTLEIDRVGTGFYRRSFAVGNPDMEIEVGKSYKINFSTFDGRSYESKFEPLVDVPKIDSISFEPVPVEFVFTDGVTTRQDSVVRFSVNTPLTPEGSTSKVALLWNLRETFRVTDQGDFGSPAKTCYVTEELDVTKVKVFDGINNSANRLDKFTVHDHNFNARLAEGAYFEVVQSGLSLGAFQYWDQISQVLDRDGNMFETPAGRIATNFFNTQDETDQVFGYFYATNTDTARVFVSPQVASNPRALCPPLGMSDNPCPEPLCCDCLDSEISTLTRPDYWTE